MGNPPADRDSAWDEVFDVVIIGAGAAGLSAAIEAGLLNSSVAVLEKSDVVGGEARLSGGVMAGHGTRRTREQGCNATFEQVWEHFENTAPTFGRYNPEVARLVAEHGGETIDWLESLGVEFEDDLVADPNYAPHLRIVHQVAQGGPGFVEPLLRAATAAGAVIRKETPVTRIVQDASGVVIGVEVTRGGKTSRIGARKGVLLASGGYGANAKLIELLNPAMRNVGFVCSPHSMGDGLALAAGVGAVTVRTGDGPMLLPSVNVDGTGMFQWHAIQGGGMLLGEDAKRFVNEDLPYTDNTLPLAILKQIDKQQAKHVWMIVNDGHYLKHARHIHPVELVEADTIEEMARKVDLDPQALTETVARYNRFCAEQVDRDLGRVNFLIPLEKGPFFASKVRPAAVMTIGGVRTDARARVIGYPANTEESRTYGPIPALYAAGQVTDWPGVGGWTVSSAFTMGRIAGREIATR